MTAELAEAERLLRAVRDHKRAARQHRESAKQLMRRLDDLIAAAADRGIHIDINRTAQPGGHSGHQHDQHQTQQARG